MQLKKMMMALAAGSLAIAAQGLTLSVKDVHIAQRYPWNGLVDIDYTVVHDDADADVYVFTEGTNNDTWARTLRFARFSRRGMPTYTRPTVAPLRS